MYWIDDLCCTGRCDGCWGVRTVSQSSRQAGAHHSIGQWMEGATLCLT
jgi:hypothetical protein